MDTACGVRVERNLDDVVVSNNEQSSRFEATVDGLRSLITYRRFPDRLVLQHTEVPAPLEGKGLAAKLTRAALDFARANHLRVVPLCPYVSRFLRRHREYQDLLSPSDLQKILSH
jgi:predicted GNAT family acetyltransferase